ncbi:hypothetical protein ACFYVL_35150 [Streptomyces sp. NPDC004111]|uniref:hypothetical protein n=1 Tax=Streptomyces sp. NPDC004111 TaxID=3364690 RepID=UPI0036C29C65
MTVLSLPVQVSGAFQPSRSPLRSPDALPALSVRDLSNSERAVALYASDMPDAYRHRSRDDDQELESWIVEGAVRLGLDELHQSAAFLSGFQLLGRFATSEQTKAHRVRFPKKGRLRRVGELASLTVLIFRMSDEACERGKRPQVEGACRCAGTGWTEFRYELDEPTSVAKVNCPGHNPDGHIPSPVGVFA